MKKKLIHANSRSRLVALPNLRKGWSTFLHQVYSEDNYPIIREDRLRDVPLDKRFSFFIYFASFFILHFKFFCAGVALFYVVCILLKTSSAAKFAKWLFKNILTKLTLKIEEISIALIFKQNLLWFWKQCSWPVALRKCRIPFLKD